jgi:hypothetical protein
MPPIAGDVFTIGLEPSPLHILRQRRRPHRLLQRSRSGGHHGAGQSHPGTRHADPGPPRDRPRLAGPLESRPKAPRSLSRTLPPAPRPA